MKIDPCGISSIVENAEHEVHWEILAPQDQWCGLVSVSSFKDWSFLFGLWHAREVLGRLVVTHESRLIVIQCFCVSIQCIFTTSC